MRVYFKTVRLYASQQLKGLSMRKYIFLYWEAVLSTITAYQQCFASWTVPISSSGIRHCPILSTPRGPRPAKQPTYFRTDVTALIHDGGAERVRGGAKR